MQPNEPVFKPPHWGWNVVAYLFAGGIAGGLGVIAALADPRDESGRKLRRTAQIGSLAISAVIPPILISHLGRPERFLYMLRTFKPGSPMSLGVWGLVAYSAIAGINVFADDDALTIGQAVLGAYVTGYTGVLLAATAVPLWSDGEAHIPAACVCSGIASASAFASVLSVLTGNSAAVRRLESFELVATAAEAIVLMHFATTKGERARRLVLRAAPPLAIAFVAGLIHPPRRYMRARSLITSGITLIAGYLFRHALIEEAKR